MHRLACRLGVLFCCTWFTTGCIEMQWFQHGIGDVSCDAYPITVRPGDDVTSIWLLPTTTHGEGKRYLPALLEACAAHPGLDARLGPAPDKTGGTILWLQLDVIHRGSLQNALIGFPGMLIFLPTWLGFAFEAEVRCRWRLSMPDGAIQRGHLSLVYHYRELNPPRAMWFITWPSTGFYGTQFIVGLVMAPLMCCYDAESDACLQQAIGQDVGERLAARFHKLLGRP